MARSERQEAARSRLSRNRQRHAASDDVAADVLSALNVAVSRRGAVDDAEANRVVSDEMRRMRADKRARDWLAGRR
jgi:uncharacterized membrane protein YebE (DUF533 family)